MMVVSVGWSWMAACALQRVLQFPVDPRLNVLVVNEAARALQVGTTHFSPSVGAGRRRLSCGFLLHPWVGMVATCELHDLVPSICRLVVVAWQSLQVALQFPTQVLPSGGVEWRRVQYTISFLRSVS